MLLVRTGRKNFRYELGRINASENVKSVGSDRVGCGVRCRLFASDGYGLRNHVTRPTNPERPPTTTTGYPSGVTISKKKAAISVGSLTQQQQFHFPRGLFAVGPQGLVDLLRPFHGLLLARADRTPHRVGAARGVGRSDGENITRDGGRRSGCPAAATFARVRDGDGNARRRDGTVTDDRRAKKPETTTYGIR